jgi:hypothetical protein
LAAIAASTAPAQGRPTVVVACPAGERHDIAPLAFSILLRRQGWQVRYLGADTPVADLAFACRRIQPDLVVVAASRPTALLGAVQGFAGSPPSTRWPSPAPGRRGRSPRPSAWSGSTETWRRAHCKP